MYLYILVFLVFFLLFKNISNDSHNTFSNNEVILFYTDWCKYSKIFIINIWNKLIKYLDKNNIKYKMIDCDKNPKLCNKMKILGYPTLKIKLDNKIIEYKGQRDLNNIKNFILSYF